MSLSKIQIYNSALQRCGVNKIVSPNDNSTEAELCNEQFELSFRELLRMHQWSCATKRIELGRLLDVPAFGWDYQYQLPPDFIRMIEVKDKGRYVIEHGRLLSNKDSCAIRYVGEVEVSELDPGFVYCLVLLLASKIMTPLTGNVEMPTQMIQELHQLALPQAKVADVMDEREAVSSNGWLDYNRYPASL